ncbi:MAG TPA: DUF937 domain-containing protein [Prolixibacteraceae bacterium]|nr:DUF937 domain-containing protein [Prolixibacteraceae bacterium]
MENLLNSILSKVDDQSLETISKQANTTPMQAKSALSSAIPVLMGALAKNSKTPEGASSLQNAIQKDHYGGLLDNLGGFFNNPASGNGQGILNHVLGDKQQAVAHHIGQESGVSDSSASKILEMAAPLVMSFLGKKSAGGGGIGNLLGSFMNDESQANPQSQSFINKLLDKDNDGSVMDDLGDMGKSFFGKMMK